MIQRVFLPASFLSGAAALAFACSSSSSNNAADSGTPDAATSPDSAGNNTPDGSQSTPDGSGDSASGNPDGGIGPQGNQLVASSTVTIDGVTSDGFVIYTDTSAHTISAIPLAGGATTAVGAVDASNDVIVVGALVLFQASATSAGTGPMSAWKSGGTATVISTASFLEREFFAVSSDGASIMILDDINPTTLVADLVVEHVDGTAKSIVVSGIDLQSALCQPSLVFGGTIAFAAYCPSASPDAGAEDAGGGGSGTAVATVTAWSPAGTTWSPAPIATGVQPNVVTDSTGANVLLQSPAGLTVYAAGDAGSTLIDSTGTTGVFTSDGQSVLYATSLSTLNRSTIASPSPVTLAAHDFAFLVAGSPDGNWMLGGLTAGQGGSDLYLSSTSTTGAPHTPLALSLAATAAAGGALYGDAFTVDSSNALYYTSTDPTSGAGTLNAIPTGGGTPAVLSSNNAAYDIATTGTNVVFGDNLTGGGGQSTPRRLDLELVDVTNATAVTLMVSQADANFFVSADKSNLAYSWSATPGSQAGVWVLPLQ